MLTRGSINSDTGIFSTLTDSVSSSCQYRFCFLEKMESLLSKASLDTMRVSPNVLDLLSIHGSWLSSQAIPRIRSSLKSKSRIKQRSTQVKPKNLIPKFNGTLSNGASYTRRETSSDTITLMQFKRLSILLIPFNVGHNFSTLQSQLKLTKAYQCL